MLAYIINMFIGMLPATRLYKLKNYLWCKVGYNIKSSARITSSVKIIGRFNLKVGDKTFIGHETMIVGGQSNIIIGANCDISSRVTIITGTHEIDMTGKKAAGNGKSLNIEIKDGVWVGVGSIILGGITVGEKSIIAAGSLVNKDVPPKTIVAGVPAKIIKRYDEVKSEWQSSGLVS